MKIRLAMIIGFSISLCIGAQLNGNAAGELEYKMEVCNLNEDALKAYQEKCEELIGRYGSSRVVIDDEEHEKFLAGLSVVQLIDLDQDEIEDMVCVYRDEEGEYSKCDGMNYSLSVWSYKDGKMNELLDIDHIGYYTYEHDVILDNDNYLSFFGVYQDTEGNNVIQLMMDFLPSTESLEQKTQYGYCYENYVFVDGKVQKEEFLFSERKFLHGDQEITAEEWEKCAINFNKILYLGAVADNCFYESKTNQMPADEIDKTFSQNNIIIEQLNKGEPIKSTIAEKEIIQSCLAFFDKLRQCAHMEVKVNDFFSEDFFPWPWMEISTEHLIFNLIDIDKDGVPELILSNISGYAGAFNLFFIYKDDKWISSEEYPLMPSIAFYTGTEPGVLQCFSHMDVKGVTKITKTGDVIEIQITDLKVEYDYGEELQFPGEFQSYNERSESSEIGYPLALYLDE